jgi:exonuclease SbcC
MEGFLAYRHRTEVDFTDADLFVLCGPTGAGKSSVIDGLTFALYGTIPRLANKTAVAPVISAQSDRARVAFEFSIGEETFTAVRLVERTKSGGATTAEARLQRGEEVLAGNADEVTAAVTGLLGLTYDHFTKAVVLPQGEFADFLTDKPSDRQALLRALLDIGLYEKVMQLANARAKSAEGKAEALAEELAKLDVPPAEQVEEARRRLEAVLEAGKELPGRIEVLKELQAAAVQAVGARDSAADVLARLEGIEVPDDLVTIDRDREEATVRLGAVADSLARFEDTVREVDQALSTHPALPQLESWLTDGQRLASLVGDRAALDLDALSASTAEALRARDAARADLEGLRVEHAAHELRRGLTAGDTCPVCHAVVGTVPQEIASAGSLDRAAAEVTRLEAEADAARDRLKEAEGESRQIGQRVGEIEQRLSGAPAGDVLEEEIASVRGLLERRATLEQSMAATEAELAEAQATVQRLEARASGLREALLTARDRVASEGPPLPGEDAAKSWLEFEDWRADRVTSGRIELERLARLSGEAEAEAERVAVQTRSWLEQLGVETTSAPETDLALAVERRRAEVIELEKTIADSDELGRRIEFESARAGVASALGTHLRSSNFEAWLLEEAMETLVDGANRLLDDLTAGAYSLLFGKSQFEVIDHRNADLRRTTRGLSGGETFLVALALSLSMAEQLAELTGTSSRLESVLLDEGFGSLDQESLDLVATVLDELVGRGRTVGIVTHVRELADRIPVRFEVRKGPETSSIEKVLT